MQPTLVILAAGMGSRYGGLKQLEAVGPNGATIMDYSIYDARRSGFGRVVFVIRPDMEEAFRAQVGSRYEAHIPVSYVFQKLDDLPEEFSVPTGREKPWGTGHALWAARGRVDEPLAVINADDFYGGSAIASLAGFLKEGHDGDVPVYAMVGYSLCDTLSSAGTVNRGLCQCTADGWLERIEETVNIAPHGNDAKTTDASGKEVVLRGEMPVSMNLWGFTPTIFSQIDARFRRFLEQFGNEVKSEFYLPALVQELIDAGEARVRVLRTKDVWCGVTNPQDKARVQEMIGALVAGGKYPEKLWG